MNDDNEKPAKTKLYAVFSEKQRVAAGSNIYRKPDGSEVHVTCVDTVQGCPECKFADKVDLGEVTQWVRAGHSPTRPEIGEIRVLKDRYGKLEGLELPFRFNDSGGFRL